MMTSFEDYSEMRCRFCNENTIYTDYAQGDAVCTSCGVVNVERLPYCGAEWRDYSAVNDDQDKKYAARAGSVVDESRWHGGLEPTCLGPVYGGYSGEAERHRKKLNKIKRVVDNWTDKEFEKRVHDSRLALKMKEEKRKKQKDTQDDEDEDWTQLGTNEHEQVALQRMEEQELSNKMFISEKWSLDRALLLHGSSHEIPSRPDIYDEAPRNIEEERETLLKRMDASQRKASSDLYEIYALTRDAIRSLGLAGDSEFMAEVMGAICRYANLKGSLSVRGVTTKIQETLKSNLNVVEHRRNMNKLRQIGSLASAFIYLICKKNGLGRNVAEICDGLKHPNFSASTEAFIGAKHCSRAISDIRVVMPDFVQAVTLASAKPLEIHSTTNKSRHATVTTNMVDYSLKNLNLSVVALAAVTNVAVRAPEYTTDEDVKPSVLVAAVTYLVCDAGSTMQRLASQAAASVKMEETSSVSVNNSSNENGKRTYIRPGFRSFKRRRVVGTETETDTRALITKVTGEDHQDNSNSPTLNKEPTSVTPEPDSFDALLQPSSTSLTNYPPTWYEWKREKPWARSMKDIEACCKVTSTAARKCYKTQIYPKRKELLEILQRSFPHNTTIDGCKVDVMFANITVASSLMVGIPR